MEVLSGSSDYYEKINRVGIDFGANFEKFSDSLYEAHGLSTYDRLQVLAIGLLRSPASLVSGYLPRLSSSVHDRKFSDLLVPISFFRYELEHAKSGDENGLFVMDPKIGPTLLMHFIQFINTIGNEDPLIQDFVLSIGIDRLVELNNSSRNGSLPPPHAYIQNTLFLWRYLELFERLDNLRSGKNLKRIASRHSVDATIRKRTEEVQDAVSQHIKGKFPYIFEAT